MSDEKIDFVAGFYKDSLLRQLSVDSLSIEFLKKDGTTRKMLCTLNENMIPKEKAPKNTGRAKNEDVIAVYDLEKQEWRSFRFHSISRIEKRA